MSQATESKVTTYSEYVRVENMLHRLYKDESPSYAAVFNRYGHTLSTARVATLAGQHGTTLAALVEDGLDAYPVKRGESEETTDYGTAHVFEQLGY